MRNTSWLAIALGVGLGCAGALGAPGCTVTTSNADLDGGGFLFGDSAPGTGDDGGGATSPACNTCTYAQCAGQYSVCSTNTECTNAYECALQCNAGDTACVGDCLTAHPDGEAAYRALAACDLQAECLSCVGRCPAPDCSSITPPSGGDAGTVLPPADAGGGPSDAAPGDDGGPAPADAAAPPPDAGSVTACDQCQQAQCASQSAACAPGSPCATYNQCVIACANQACIDQCGAANPSGKQAATALGQCTATSCAGPCGL
jgi:hypothetical protein